MRGYTWVWRTFGIYLASMLVGFLLSMFGVVTYAALYGGIG